MSTNASPSAAHILVVDDEPDLRTLYELTLLREGYHVDVAENVANAWQQLGERAYDVLITDMRLPDGLGIDLLNRLRAHKRGERSVVITAYGSAENAVESLKAGAFDYLTKPVDLRQFRNVIASAVQDALAHRGASVTNSATAMLATPFVRSAQTPNATPVTDATLQRLVGNSSAMRQVRERVVKVSRSMAPVLICGESGTGKELIATALHANSHRASGPLIAVNCSAIPENLLETEFFGVRKGAYTGATHDRDGFFQAAHGGTLFLDEIGDLPLSMQAKLLRAIQERCVRPVGGTQEEPADARIISATHKNLAREVQQGRFRQDLYYRLNVIEITVPALRDRLEDLPQLCNALLTRIAKESHSPVPQLNSQALAVLAQHPFPGNVRELENLLHRAMALSEDDELVIEPPSFIPQPDDAPLATTSAPAPLSPMAAPEAAAEGDLAAPEVLPVDLQDHLDLQERDILIKALQETGYNRTAAAARLGLSLRQIRYRIERLNIAMPHGSDSNR